MGSIVDFNNILSNKNENINLIASFEDSFSKCMKKNLKDIKEYNDISNLNFLIDRYNKVIESFKNGTVEPSKLKLFLDKLSKVTENSDNEINYIYFVLYFFNSYKIYGNDFILLSDSDIKMAIELYSTYEMAENIKDLEHLLDGLFDDVQIKRLKEICNDRKKALHNYVSAFDIFLEDKDSDIPFSYYFKNYIDDLEQEQKDKENRISIFERGILTPESVYEEIKDNVFFYAQLVYSNAEKHNDSLVKQEAIDMMNNLDNMIFKLKNIEEPKRTECLIYIRGVWTNKEKNIYMKKLP